MTTIEEVDTAILYAQWSYERAKRVSTVLVSYFSEFDTFN